MFRFALNRLILVFRTHFSKKQDKMLNLFEIKELMTILVFQFQGLYFQFQDKKQKNQKQKQKPKTKTKTKKQKHISHIQNTTHNTHLSPRAAARGALMHPASRRKPYLFAVGESRTSVRYN
jgi:hypothetical protein